MKREILFRGKCNSGEWVYGGITSAMHHPEKKQQIVFSVLYDGSEEVEYIAHIDVDPATIGQSTGLTDKNGVKIFEGDVVKTSFFYKETHKSIADVLPIMGCVEYSEGICSYEIKNHSGTTPIYRLHLFNIEIIGNIHDNPELLK